MNNSFAVSDSKYMVDFERMVRNCRKNVQVVATNGLIYDKVKNALKICR